MTKPPSILVEAGLMSPDTRWVVEAAVYGLDSSPADWQSYRDEMLQSLGWWLSGVHYWVNPTPEPNVWRLMPVNAIEDSYVDDFIVMGAPTAAGEFLNKLASTWKCSTSTWVSEGEWKKFCRVEVKWQGKDLLIGQPD